MRPAIDSKVASDLLRLLQAVEEDVAAGVMPCSADSFTSREELTAAIAQAEAAGVDPLHGETMESLLVS